MDDRAAISRGWSKLAFDAGVGITELVESMHLNIARAPGMLGSPLEGSTTGITGLVYRSVKGAFRLAGYGVDTLLAQLGPMLGDAQPSPRSDNVLSALNGVMGDHLVATGNPLAMPMRLRMNASDLQLTREALTLEIPEPGRRVVVLVHGLCLNDRHWNRNGHDHGAVLARDIGITPIYLRYNTGQHISTNGRAFADLLEALVAEWPVPLEELTIIGHSMGGLVARSACHAGREASHVWPSKLRKLVFLGTPHHGAPAERAGHWLDVMIGKSPYIAPFRRLGRIRSAGITDLRYGSIVDDDWQGADRFHHTTNAPQIVPLPKGVRCFAIAGSIGPQAGGKAFGDGLVPVDNALGHHDEAARNLSLPKSHEWVGRSIHHLELLNSPQVYKKIRKWLS